MKDIIQTDYSHGFSVSSSVVQSFVLLLSMEAPPQAIFIYQLLQQTAKATAFDYWDYKPQAYKQCTLFS